MRRALCTIGLFGFTACITGGMNYVPPTTSGRVAVNSKMVPKARDVVWSALIPKLGQTFYVINNLDKASGLINVSYSGDPEKYVDCGQIHSSVKNARGESRWDFAAAKGQQDYMTTDGSHIFAFDRRMALEGRINVILEEVSTDSTRITVNTRYALRKTILARNAVGGASTGSKDDSVTFSSGGSATFPGGSPTTCAATGELESQLLALVE
jgi:hypothetical protein